MTPERTPRSEITVVIPTLGRDILRRALEALVAGTHLPCEVVVVDQSASPAVEAMLRDAAGRGLPTRWLPSHQRGRAAGVNRGIEAVTSRFLAITDDDCLAHPEWIERLTAQLERYPGEIVTGRVDAGDETVLLRVTSERPFVQRRRSLRFDRLSGGNMAMARDLAARVGPLDESPYVRNAEDHEYAYRALRAGIPIRYAPDAAVTHLGWRDDESRQRQYDGYARSHGGFYGKYLRRGDAFIAARAAIHWMRALRRWATNSVRGDRERARMARAYVTGLPSGILAGWRSASTVAQ